MLCTAINWRRVGPTGVLVYLSWNNTVSMRCYKATAPPNPVFLDADYAYSFFFATHDSSGYCDWPQSNAEKRSAVKDKPFPAFIRVSFATMLFNTATVGTFAYFYLCSCVPCFRRYWDWVAEIDSIICFYHWHWVSRNCESYPQICVDGICN